MGVRQLPRIAEQLIAHGRDPGEPAAIVERGTLPDQRVLRDDAGASLGEQERARARGDRRRPRRRAARRARVVRPRPARRRQRRGDARPRPGQRPRGAPAGARRARGRGARHPHRAAAPSSSATSRAYDLLVLTSPNGVERALRATCATRGRWPGPRSPSIGPGTAAALRARGDRGPTSCPSARSARGSREALAGRGVPHARSSRAPQDARDVVPDALRDAGSRGRRRSRSTAPSPSRWPRRRAPPRWAPTGPTFTSALGGALLPRRRRHARRPAPGLDRPGHERGAARARLRARPRGRRSHARRARRRARERPPGAAERRGRRRHAATERCRRRRRARRPRRQLARRDRAAARRTIGPPVGAVVEDGALVEPRARLGAEPHGEQGEDAEDRGRKQDADEHLEHGSRLRRSDTLSTSVAWATGPSCAAQLAAGGSPSVGMPGIASGPRSGSSSPSGPRLGNAERRLFGLVGRQPAGSVVGGARLIAHGRHATRPPSGCDDY